MVFRAYDRLLIRYPMPTKMLTTGFLFGLGDFLCQNIQQKDSPKFNLDMKRLARFSFLGCFLVTPILNLQYGYVLPRFAAATP